MLLALPTDFQPHLTHPHIAFSATSISDVIISSDRSYLCYYDALLVKPEATFLFSLSPTMLCHSSNSKLLQHPQCNSLNTHKKETTEKKFPENCDNVNGQQYTLEIISKLVLDNVWMLQCYYIDLIGALYVGVCHLISALFTR